MWPSFKASSRSLVLIRSRSFTGSSPFSVDNPPRDRNKPLKSISEVSKSNKLFSAKQYDHLAKTGHKLLRRHLEKGKEGDVGFSVDKKDHRRKKKQQQQQIEIDKASAVLTKGAMRRKMSAITTWAKREHPEIWERIVSKISLRETLQGSPWEPAVLLVRK